MDLDFPYRGNLRRERHINNRVSSVTFADWKSDPALVTPMQDRYCNIAMIFVSISCRGVCIAAKWEVCIQA